jgi:hypothetical protein
MSAKGREPTSTSALSRTLHIADIFAKRRNRSLGSYEGLMSIERAELEHVARSIGERWGRNLRARHEASGRRLGAWPCGLEEARNLIDALLGTRLSEEEREPLAIIAERSARRAWGPMLRAS